MPCVEYMTRVQWRHGYAQAHSICSSRPPLSHPLATLVPAAHGGPERSHGWHPGTRSARHDGRELEAVNRSDSHVLILDGEQLIGAKQNRTTNRTVLVGRRSVTRIPVSCMEQGRWRDVGRKMQTGGYHAPSKVRKIARVREAKERARRQAGQSSGRSAGDAGNPSHLLREVQGEVWASIADSSARAGVRSSTGDLFEVYRGKLRVLEERAARFRPLPGQVGLVAFAGESLLGLDLVGDPTTFARLHDRLVRGYLFDALEREQWSEAAPGDGEADSEAGRPDREAVEALLRQVAESPRQPLPTAGLGEYRALEGPVVGGELEWDGAVVHLSAFPAD